MGKTGNKTNLIQIARRLAPYAVIVFFVAVFSFSYWGKGLIPFPSRYLVTFFPPWSASYGMPVKNAAMPDVITQIYPWKRFTIETWKRKEVPLWNPYSFSGTAHAGNYQTAVFSPINLLFFLLSEIDAWSIMILLQPLIAGLGTYVFLRRIGRSVVSSVLGSLSWMFCGFIVVWMAYGTLGYAISVLPFALYVATELIEKKTYWSGPLLSFVVAFSFLSGHFQMSLYFFFYLVGYCIATFYRVGEKRNGMVPLLYIAVGLAIALPQIVLTIHSYLSSVRSAMFINGEIIPWQYLVTLFSPDFYGNPVTRNDWFGHYAEWSSYIGVLPLLFSGFALVFARSFRGFWYFFWAGFVSFLLAFPTPVLSLLFASHIPVLSTSAASRIIVLVSFSLSVLAAYGLDALVLSWEKKQTFRRFLAIAGIGIGVLIVVWLYAVLGVTGASGARSIAVRNTILPTGFLLVGLIASGIGYIVRPRFKKGILFLFFVITAVDMVRFAAKWMPFEPREYMYPVTQSVSVVQNAIQSTNARVIGNIGGEVAVAFGIPVLEGYDAVYQKRYGEFISAATDGKPRELSRSVVTLPKEGTYTEDIVRLLGARYLMHRVSDGRSPWAYPFWKYDSYVSIWKDDTYEVFENTSALPRAFLASGYRLETSDKQILSTLFSPDLNRATTLVLEQKPTYEPREGTASATIRQYSATRVVVDVTTIGSKLLFLSDVYDDGWNVYIDGKSAPLMRADYAFRAVSVPEGSHTITFVYWPQWLTYAFVFAGFGTLWCIGAFVRGKRV